MIERESIVVFSIQLSRSIKCLRQWIRGHQQVIHQLWTRIELIQVIERESRIWFIDIFSDPSISIYFSGFYPAYSTPQPYHPSAVPTTKYSRLHKPRNPIHWTDIYLDQYSTYERDSNLTYGQARSSSNDLTNSSQPTKDVSATSTLSATAAAFSQGAPLTTTNSTGTFIINPVHYSMPPYIPLASIDSRVMIEHLNISLKILSFLRIIEVVLLMVVKRIEYLTSNNVFIILIHHGSHNSNNKHSCEILSYFLFQHLHWFDFHC